MTKALLIIAEQNFRDEELFETKKEVEKKEIITVIASKTSGEKTGSLGGKAKADIALKDVKPGDYNAIIFIGGAGARQYFNDFAALTIAKQAYNKGKIVAAICIAPVILANAGILKNKKATVWKSTDEIKILKEKGAIYEDKNVVVSGNIITACGPQASKEFGETIANLL